MGSNVEGELLPTQPYSPCPNSSSSCSVVDGKLSGLGLGSIASQGVFPFYSGLDTSRIPYVRSAVGIALILILLCCFSRRCGLRTGAKSYQPLESSASDDDTDE